MEFKDYYQILGVSRTAAEDEIKKAYRRLARKYHPDVSKEAHAEARFKEVAEAWEVLRDPEKRADYDRLGPNFRNGQDFRPPPGWRPHAGAGAHRGGGPSAADGFSQADFSEFFESIFGGGGGAQGVGARA
ncbi:MAG TPA: DnaJ domain-containing protein, partial [Plasticicumulans sp.]|nr:DnaJ domain-containing protein [Plasticicumulans sp.]